MQGRYADRRLVSGREYHQLHSCVALSEAVALKGGVPQPVAY